MIRSCQRHARGYALLVAIPAIAAGCADVLGIDDVGAWESDASRVDTGAVQDRATNEDKSVEEESHDDGAVDATSDVSQTPSESTDAADSAQASSESGDANDDSPRLPSDASSPSDGAPRDAGITPPRLMAPLSTATVTSQRPVLRWVLGTDASGALVEVCRDRDCAQLVTQASVTGTTWSPPTSLSRGVYFWRAYGMFGGVAGLTPTPTWQFAVGARSAVIPTSWGSTLDVNGDGYADVAVGAPATDGDTGAVYVYFGSPTGPSSSPDVTLAAPDGMRSEFGRAVASAGDVNGDGFADLVVGAHGVQNLAGRVYVYFGSSSGLPKQPSVTLSSPDGGDLYPAFGSSVAGAGDMNGDGYADVAVGSKGVYYGAGRAYVYLGGPSGPSAGSRTRLVRADELLIESFGVSVSGAGDVNGDEYGDVIVGTDGLRSGGGRAYVYLGAAAPAVQTWNAAAMLTSADGVRFGISVAGAGDVNGDGYSDFVVGDDAAAPASRGNATIYLGRPLSQGFTPSSVRLNGAMAGDRFGTSVAGGGDFDGDGFSDIVVGASDADSFGGRAYVFRGSLVTFSTTASKVLIAPDGSGFGGAVGIIGDADGDRYVDLIVGAFAVNGAGRAYVYRGSLLGPPSDPTSILNAPAPAGDFGAAVAP